MTLTDTTIDVRHLGRVTSVASQLLATDVGPVLLDTGPASVAKSREATAVSRPRWRTSMVVSVRVIVQI